MAMTTIENELLALERRYWQALKAKDLETALSLTDDPCIVVGAQGVRRVDHETFASVMKGSDWDIVDFSIGDDVEVQVVGDAAFLAYVVHEDVVVAGEALSFDAADSSTWIRRDGRWRCTLHTESILGDPFGRDRSAR